MKALCAAAAAAAAADPLASPPPARLLFQPLFRAPAAPPFDNEAVSFSNSYLDLLLLRFVASQGRVVVELTVIDAKRAHAAPSGGRWQGRGHDGGGWPGPLAAGSAPGVLPRRVALCTSLARAAERPATSRLARWCR